MYLAARRNIKLKVNQSISTPLLIPSFSSKGFPEVDKLISTAEEVITDTTLISAYDIYYKNVPNKINFPEILFLDSGGYEASKDADFSDLGYSQKPPSAWDEEKHLEVLSKWRFEVPTVVISYDSPEKRVDVLRQYADARLLVNKFPGVIREILIKPETDKQNLVQVSSVIENIDEAKDFDIIGFTEKELGSSILKRMENIARIRTALNSVGLDIPIHVFGSLDTITTSLYFLSGADIFDGLTWLRFAYHNGYTSYIHNHIALELGIQTYDRFGAGKIWFQNYYYLKKLELQMKSFLNEKNFKEFTFHADFLERSYQALVAKLSESGVR